MDVCSGACRAAGICERPGPGPRSPCRTHCSESRRASSIGSSQRQPQRVQMVVLSGDERSPAVPRTRTCRRRLRMEGLLASVAPSIHRFWPADVQERPRRRGCLQDTLLAIATHLDEFEGRSSFLSWGVHAGADACSRHRRGLKNQRPASLSEVAEPLDGARTPEERACDRGSQPLSAPRISVDALKSRLHRAREALRGASSRTWSATCASGPREHLDNVSPVLAEYFGSCGLVVLRR
jgi:DNA-directed RNA polymerase specialized sigma24 family protein